MKINKRWLKLVIKNNTELTYYERKTLLRLSLGNRGLINDYLKFENKNDKLVYIAYLQYRGEIIASCVTRYRVYTSFRKLRYSACINFYTKAKYRKQGLCKYLSYVAKKVFIFKGCGPYTHWGYSYGKGIGEIQLPVGNKKAPKGFRPIKDTAYKSYKVYKANLVTAE